MLDYCCSADEKAEEKDNTCLDNQVVTHGVNSPNAVQRRMHPSLRELWGGAGGTPRPRLRLRQGTLRG